MIKYFKKLNVHLWKMSNYQNKINYQGVVQYIEGAKELSTLNKKH